MKTLNQKLVVLAGATFLVIAFFDILNNCGVL